MSARLFALPLLLPALACSQSAATGPGLDAAGRAQVIDGLARILNQAYVFPEVAKKIETALREREKTGAYASIQSSPDFARALTADVQGISHDKHLRVLYWAEGRPDPGAPTPEDIDRLRIEMRAQLRAANFGFEKIERMEGNVGYLDLRGFAPVEFARETGIAAMAVLANTDALIVDLRHNGGGAPNMVAFLSSYLFDKRVHLDDLYWREGNRTEEFWTDPAAPGAHYVDKPVYVLTSPRTFSGAEEFCYSLQTLRRATLVGETTGGGAHPGSPRRINEHFAVWTPAGRAINPVTKTNWEGAGVKPDIGVPEEDALKTAHAAALRTLFATARDARRREALGKALQALKGR